MKDFAAGMNEGDESMKTAKRGAWKKAFGEEYDENIGGDQRGMVGPHEEVENAEDEGLSFVDHEPIPVPIDKGQYPELAEDGPGDRARLVFEGSFDEQGTFQADRTAAVHGMKFPTGGGYRDVAGKSGYKSGQQGPAPGGGWVGPPGSKPGGVGGISTRGGGKFEGRLPGPKGMPHENKGLPGGTPVGGGESSVPDTGRMGGKMRTQMNAMRLRG